MEGQKSERYRLQGFDVLRAEAEERGDPTGIETLAEQVPVDASKDGRVAQRESVTKPAVERLLEKRVFIELREDFGYRVPGDVAVDPKRLDLADDARGRDA